MVPQGIAIHRPIVYGNIAHYVPPADRPASWPTEHTHRWTVAVRSATGPPPLSHRRRGPRFDGQEDVDAIEEDDLVGGADDLTHFIRRVTFKLHDTYPNPNRSIDKPPFQVTETGWGEFEIAIKIFFVQESGEKPLQLTHSLKLHDWKSLPSQTTGAHGPVTIALEPVPPGPSAAAAAASRPTEPPDLPGPSRPLKPGEPLPGSGQGGEDGMDLDAEGELDLDGLPPPPPEDPPSTKPDPPATAEAADAPEDDASAADGEKSSKPPPQPAHAINSWQYDEIIFTSPTETFYATLLSLPPTPLPQSSRPGRTAHRLGASGHGGELTQDLEEREGRRLEWARNEVVRMGEAMRQRLIGREKELEGIKRDVATLQQAQLV